MPAGAPFTYLCQMAGLSRSTGWVDLHAHSTASDGLYTPEQIVDLARRAGLAAIAITDHDTMAGVEPGRQAAANHLEFVSGVEISCRWMDREVHLLAYFIRLNDPALNAALDKLRECRQHRYHAMVQKLRSMGVRVNGELPAGNSAVGRRNLAARLYESGEVDSIRDGFNKYLDDNGPAFVPKELLALDIAIELVRNAGGVSSYAHPGTEVDARYLAQLAEIGLDAVEVEYPSFKTSRKQQLRQWATDLNLAVTGGSDCHGPGIAKRSIGICSISRDELLALQQRALRAKRVGVSALPSTNRHTISHGMQ